MKSHMPMLAAAVALVCVLSLLPAPAAAGYIYPSDCPAACAPTQTYNATGYTLCVNNCNVCLLNSGCYSQFQPYFTYYASGVGVYTAFSCWCYIPWWGWFLIAIGIALCIGACVACAYFVSKRS